MELKMEKEFHELKVKVDDIHRILLGSEHEEDVGILARVKRNESEIKNINDWKSKVTYFAYGMIVPASYGVFDVVKTIINALN